MRGDRKHILARSRHVASEPSAVAEETGKSSRCEAEFCFVVGIYQPQGSVNYPAVCFGAQTFKVLYDHSGASDTHQFVDAAFRFSHDIQILLV